MSSRQHPLFARFFDRSAGRNEEKGNAQLRQEMLAGLTGTVVEAGAGNGLNFPHYPAGVAQVIAVEPSDYLRQRATDAARAVPVPVRVIDGTAERIPADDASVDAVVVSGVLCSVTDVAEVLAEFRRVLRPRGELRFYEHVRSRDPLRGRAQDAADLIWPRLMGGCHPNRDTLAAIRHAGFAIDTCRGLIFPPDALMSPVAPRVLGIARP
jgi:ubiquinone/menaquinone biosynthesis C-methylase UbiE